MAGELDVSRSSFYWYFDNLDDLHSELLAMWERNTASIVERSKRDAATIVAAVLGVFECWADRHLYDAQLDLAIRDWGRRNDVIGEQVATADALRLDAISSMFMRQGFDADDSIVRARLLYHSQVGYHALGIDEPMSIRLNYLPYYLEAMTGCKPTRDEIATFESFLETTE